MTGRVADKAAIITGAARGIGYATARLFAREGARLGLIDRDRPTLDDAARQLSAEIPGAVIHWREADISDSDAIAKAIEELVDELGKLDLLVNNAAVRAFGPVADATADSWEAVLGTNVTGLAMCSRAALAHLRKSGAGAIVNVSSIFAVAGRSNMGQYDASK